AVVAPGIELYLKCEGQNPTGSFKDRGMTVAVTRALAEGAEAVICASTGNTSASAAAYAARAGIRAYVVVPQGKIALGKLSQAVMHGARVIQIDGNFDQALRLVRDVKERYPTRLALVNSVNPHRIEGQKTAAFEICDALGRTPDYHLLPVGNAGNITAYWKGYTEYRATGVTDRLPRMMGFEAAGAAPIVHGRVIDEPRTVATAIRIGNPASWKAAEAARDESGGAIEAISDEDILAAYRLLARTANLDRMASRGILGLTRTIPRGLPPGSDVGTMSILGYDPARYHTGRSPIEAASMGVELGPDDVAFRCNLVTLETLEGGTEVMRDFAAGH